MAALDWGILCAYIGLAVGIEVWVHRHREGGRSTEAFFVAGRTLPWYVAGTSIVATTFSSDTPLLVSGLARGGLYTNWFWWCSAVGQVGSVYFFAALWRRTGAVTDLEFIALRYPPSRVRGCLRVLRVVIDGVLANCVVITSVTFAMA
eukprot:COSAG01_NODE_35742_length_527_cov_1.037383_1_plen_147_part_01